MVTVARKIIPNTQHALPGKSWSLLLQSCVQTGEAPTRGLVVQGQAGPGSVRLGAVWRCKAGPGKGTEFNHASTI